MNMMFKRSDDVGSLFNRKQPVSFLLRLWQQQIPEKNQWQISLEDPSTREVLVFQDFAALITYLTQITQKKQAENLQQKMEEE